MSTEAMGAPAPATTAEPTVVMDVDVDAPCDKSETSEPPVGLHSPPDSHNATVLDGSDSELSDLDDIAEKLEDGYAARPAFATPTPPQAAPAPAPASETAAPTPPPPVDDIGEILPDHYSGTVPVFKPTMHQFKDFKLFMEKIDSYGMQSGIVKIIPPQEWRDSLPPLDDMVKQIRVRDPIKQEIMGSNGTYRQVNILHQRSYNLPQWRQLCDQSEHQPPARRGERRANADKPKPAPRPRPAAAAAASNASTTAKSGSKKSKKQKRGRPTRKSAAAATAPSQDTAVDPDDRPMTPVSPPPEEKPRDSVETGDTTVKKEEEEEADEEEGDHVDDDASTTTAAVAAPPPPPSVRRMGFTRQAVAKTQSTSARRKYSKREGSALIDESAFEGFDYRMDVSDYTPERCEELERIYWKTLTYAPPLYGADLMGTLFHESTELWNLNKLPNLLDALGTKVPGVNTAYLYLGMWKATFAWHLEDVDLYSINYLHFGAPKQWYSISQRDARRFEAAMKSIWPTEAKACDQFLRHKAFLISPGHLKQHFGITVNKCVSYPGEFVVTYPYGYHSGYNLGYNCAEAVNFALDSWLPMGKIAKRCECAQAQDSVWVDVYEIERRLRGESTDYGETEDEEEEEEEEDDDDDAEEGTGLPSPPSSSRAVKGRGSKTKKRKRGGAAAAREKGGVKLKVPKMRPRVKPAVESPCCLCPNDIPGAEILPTDDGRRAHRMCALYVPETYIETADDGGETVANAAHIDKARLDLKCLFCRSRKGACFQCSQKKCARSYHATCAAAAGVFVEEAEVPVVGEDGTEYKEQAFAFSCRFHRTKRDRRWDGEALEENARVREAAAALRKDQLCQFQYYRGDIFAGVVVENRPDEETVLIHVVPNGDRVEVEWKWLLLPDPADFHLPRASPNALPMPTSRKAQQQINATKRPTEELPRKDDVFVEGFTWAEFHHLGAEEAIRNPDQVAVDLSGGKERQLWHYLGKTSTESKPQYTADPALPVHDPRSNFLSTIPKPLRPAPPPAVYAPYQQQQQQRQQPKPSLPAVYPAAQSWPTLATLPQQQHQQHQHQRQRAEKPYVYKPRKPIVGSTQQQFAGQFTSQSFRPIGAAASPAPLPGGASNHHPQQQQRDAFGTSYASKNPASTTTMAPPYSSTRFAPVGGSNGFPQLPGLTWPPAHMKSGHPPPPQPQSRVWSTTPSEPPPSARSTASRPAVSASQKYCFFQVHHNRDSTKYRTPYAPWGGFTNGYEGNLRAFLIKAQQSLSGNGNKTPLPAIPASLLRPFQQGGSPPTAATRPAAAAAPAGGTPWLSSYSSQPQLLSPAHASSTSSPYSAANSSATTSPRFSSSSSSSSTPLHPAIRPQYSSPFQQIPPQSALSVQQQQQQQQQRHSTPGTNHLGPWKATPNRPSPSPTVARQTSFTRQSHSPIPLPPYVRAAARPPASAASTAPGSKKVPAPTQPHRSHQETGVAVAATETTPPVGSPLAQAPANRDPPTISSTSQAAGGEGIPAAEQAVPDLPDVPAEAMLLVEQMVAKLRRASEREVVA